MNLFDEITAAANQTGLGLVGWFHPDPDDGAPDDAQTLLLFGPDGRAMWAAFQAAPEALDGAPNPLDRWSARVVSDLAHQFGAAALFPFGGAPYQPFQRWAERGESACASPVALQVTAGRGLWTSYRGALAFTERLTLPPRNDANPCLTCPAPCQTACPVDAFAGGTYDVPACIGQLATPDVECQSGCLARRACPAGAALELPADQRAFHMAAFLRVNRP